VSFANHGVSVEKGADDEFIAEGGGGFVKTKGADGSSQWRTAFGDGGGLTTSIQRGYLGLETGCNFAHEHGATDIQRAFSTDRRSHLTCQYRETAAAAYPMLTRANAGFSQKSRCA
jgi:hypothetical protein